MLFIVHFTAHLAIEDLGVPRGVRSIAEDDPSAIMQLSAGLIYDLYTVR